MYLGHQFKSTGACNPALSVIVLCHTVYIVFNINFEVYIRPSTKSYNHNILLTINMSTASRNAYATFAAPNNHVTFKAVRLLELRLHYTDIRALRISETKVSVFGVVFTQYKQNNFTEDF